MALFGQFGGVVSNVLGVLGGAGGALGAVGQLGSAVVSGLAPATTQLPVFAGGPVVQTMAPVRQASKEVAGMMGITSVVSAGRKAMLRLIAPILIKIATMLGRQTMTLREAIRMIKRMGKFLEPAAIAAALGISVTELAQLIMANSQRPSRRMNPANVHALRRSMRRIASFHRLCVKADQLRGRRRPGRRGAQCAGSGVQIVRGG